MKFKYQNCGNINNLRTKWDEINTILQKLSNRGAFYCSIVDEPGNIIASLSDKSFTKSIEKKIISLYKEMSRVKVMNFCKKIEIITLIEDFDVLLKGFLMFISKFAQEVTLIAIVPPWFNVYEITFEFKTLLKDLAHYFSEFKTQELPKFLILLP